MSALWADVPISMIKGQKSSESLVMLAGLLIMGLGAFIIVLLIWLGRAAGLKRRVAVLSIIARGNSVQRLSSLSHAHLTACWAVTLGRANAPR